ncbi:hypothetical protein STRIP9103_00983 [Streptomyces ipomoeae 91-03]|uniref:Uncharacterized protein n=1 Tax=Streptomyces ipomoeae 91-03 TaxID=698759 RepID=L1KJ34_9ACTN|nr:hypothetical protein STRIP9103_00983 [Streptomyces ipomoeae 91-03]
MSASVWSRTAEGTATKHAEHPRMTNGREEAAFLLPCGFPVQAESASRDLLTTNRQGSGRELTPTPCALQIWAVRSRAGPGPSLRWRERRATTRRPRSGSVTVRGPRAGGLAAR